MGLVGPCRGGGGLGRQQPGPHPCSRGGVVGLCLAGHLGTGGHAPLPPGGRRRARGARPVEPPAGGGVRTVARSQGAGTRNGRGPTAGTGAGAPGVHPRLGAVGR